MLGQYRRLPRTHHGTTRGVSPAPSGRRAAASSSYGDPDRVTVTLAVSLGALAWSAVSDNG